MIPDVNVAMIPLGKVNAGMPILHEPKRVISPFEFWPTWFFYTPVVLQSIALSAFYRDWALPLITNPAIKLSGMVGESKNDIFTIVGKRIQECILPFVTVRKVQCDSGDLLSNVKKQLVTSGLCYPLVAKPDLGCRGAGVKLINSDEQLKNYIEIFPVSGRFLLQKKSVYNAEAGIFYIRQPDEPHGKIFSITLKYSPVVIGDGRSTVKELIEKSPRANKLKHLYLPRHSNCLDYVVPDKHEFQLAFAGSHSRGAIFRNGNQFVTQALEKKLDKILEDFEGFNYGRIDIKFQDIQTLMKGEFFNILEINGASSEAGHIWDSDTSIRDIFKTLLKQYRILYQIGAKQKKQGHKTPTFGALLQAWREEKRLVKFYPMTD
ncbi:D-alanine--D-alanine ligase [Shewanella sp. YIC-542]|uniref:D-alanine--D-alanine ligase n=1 Tax=Shewanella mytili TaxID=3377111 RepID=UPI00398F33E2